MKRLVLLCTYICFAGHASASQIKLIDPLVKASADISDYEFNRITVLNDRISQVFSMGERFNIETEESSGQVFLGLKDESTDPISISIVTEKGITQDILLIPKSIPGETIIFKRVEADAAISGSLFTESQNRMSLLRAMIERKPHPSYNIINNHSNGEIEGEFFVRKLISTYRAGVGVRGYIYTIINNSEDDLHLDEKDFAAPGVHAVVLLKYTLIPAETTYLYIIGNDLGSGL